ncbi:DUF397 domain-containing protein [Actinomadura graeca]|uniref:DUF397 domain-containing protein n=1 Tax=Actinomadura graeca TaxID=2750812 RepID=A0ABX8QTY1_9ACTN|nr:DUF397 domain-containing protein [Actinomadura graeca]
MNSHRTLGLSQVTSVTHVPWRRSAACQANNGCVELARLEVGVLGARDGATSDSGVIRLSPRGLRDLFDAIGRGAYDL